MFSHLRKIFDESLALMYKDLKKAHVSLSAFWNLHGDNASLIVPDGKVIALMQATENWKHYEDDLEAVCSTMLGRAMFEWAKSKVIGEKVKDVMTELSKSFDEISNLTQTAVNSACKHARMQIANLANLELLDQKRDAEFTYRGLPISRSVTTTEEEIQLRLSSVAKGRAVQAKHLLPMTFETDLVGGRLLKYDSVDLAFIKGAAEARAAANNFIHIESDHANGQLAAKVLQVKEKTLHTMDRNIGVEIGFFVAMAGATGQAMLMQKVAETLPGVNNPRTTEDTLTLINALFSTSLFAFSSKQAQQSAELIRAAVNQLHLKRKPAPLDAKCSDQIKACFDAMSFFCTHNVIDESGTKTVYGKEAINLIHEGVAQKASSDRDSVTLADLAYGRFNWLLSSEQNTAIKNWTRKLGPSWDVIDHADASQGDQAKRKKIKLQEASVEQAVDDAFA